MKVAVVRERADTRVALVPALVGRLQALGYDVVVEPGAGEAAGHPDEEYAAAGATVGHPEADLVLSVAPFGAPVNICLTAPDTAGGTTYALERVPRISRAQTMDALTSQALVAGYRGAMVAAELCPVLLPRTTTMAGTLPAANALVLGAGVAGLQVIATLGRLGATVRAYDVRASSAEEIRSLGAEPVDLGLPPLPGAAGYAREMDAERAALQQTRLTPYVEQADIVVTTAAVPGRIAPVLVTRAMVERMRPGAVVVDLAADAGGNVEPGPGVWSERNVAAQLPRPASALYARNVVSFVEHLATAPPDDEIVQATFCPTNGGRAGT